MKRILFSPIGGTDPIANYRDGAMLHICRKYKPDVVYLYLSKEMCETHELDNRYLYCMEKLEELIKHKFEVQVILKPELLEVQIFDSFFDEFSEILHNIATEYMDCEILVNVSSGTPAMKSSLQILSAFSELNIIPIQVSTPEKKINKHEENRKNYDVETLWELNEDNVEDFENRCTSSQVKRLLNKIKLELVYKHIDVYDYVAASVVAESMSDGISDNAKSLLKIGVLRQQLDLPKIDAIQNKINITVLPTVSSEYKYIYEYILWLQTKSLRGDYADFVRGITPVVMDLFEMVVKKICKLKIKDYSSEKHGVLYWDIDKVNKDTKLKKLFQDEYTNGLNKCAITDAHLKVVILGMSDNPQINEMVKSLREIAEKVRNMAAHEIVSVSEEWVMEKTGKKTKDILEMIKRLAINTGMKLPEDGWNSYDILNDKIKAESLIK